MEHIGIDVHKNSCQVCILSEDGELVERRIKTDRANLYALFSDRPRARILVESSTESEWVARCLEELGHEVIVADPNFAPMSVHVKKIKILQVLNNIAYRFTRTFGAVRVASTVPTSHFSSGRIQHPGAQQVEFAAPVHLPLD